MSIIPDYDNTEKWYQAIMKSRALRLTLGFGGILALLAWLLGNANTARKLSMDNTVKTLREEHAKTISLLKEAHAKEMDNCRVDVTALRSTNQLLFSEVLSSRETFDPVRKMAQQLYPELELRAAVSKLADDLRKTRELANQSNFTPLAAPLKEQVIAALREAKARCPTNITVGISYENGSVVRTHLAEQISALFNAAGFSTSASGVTTFRIRPPEPLLYVMSPGLEGPADGIAGGLLKFINFKARAHLQSKWSDKANLHIEINGEPLFTAEGVVSFR